MCTSLMSVFGSIIDHKVRNIIHLMMIPWLYYDASGPWTSLTDQLIVQLQADREQV